MDKINFKIPEGCDSVNIGIVDGKIVTEFVPATVIKLSDGDILYLRQIGKAPIIVIYKNRTGDYINYHVAFDNGIWSFNGRFLDVFQDKRFALPFEKECLYRGLRQYGKHWNVIAKRIENIKKEYPFKPFDKVLVRDEEEDKWRGSFFDSMAPKDYDPAYPYKTITNYYRYCIPYEGNEQLLGTNKNIEEK